MDFRSWKNFTRDTPNLNRVKRRNFGPLSDGLIFSPEQLIPKANCISIQSLLPNADDTVAPFRYCWLLLILPLLCYFFPSFYFLSHFATREEKSIISPLRKGRRRLLQICEKSDLKLRNLKYRKTITKFNTLPNSDVASSGRMLTP